jgi:hypothetical protein
MSSTLLHQDAELTYDLMDSNFMIRKFILSVGGKELKEMTFDVV